MTGSEIAEELEKRKGNRLSPGTIYPVLKFLKNHDLISMDDDKRYSLTKNGEKELKMNLNMFFDTFYDLDEMREQCRCHQD